MKHTASKKSVQAYSFNEYKKKFPPPSPRRSKYYETPNELGIKLAEESLAKIREQARESS